MTHEEMKTIHHHFHNGLTTMLDKITQVMSAKTSWTLEEMYKASDILKDLSEVEKNVAKSSVLSAEHSEETF